MYKVVRTHLSLEEYWEILQINECAGYGIRNYPTTGVVGLGCGDYWDQRNRYYLSFAIDKVEQRLKSDRWLSFPIRREYAKPREYRYADIINLGKYTRGVGVQAETLIETVALTLSTDGVIHDPITFTVNVTFTDADEIVIKYPSSLTENCSDYTIRPSCVEISNGVATITIPRCRLLKPQYFADYVNDADRPNYKTDSNFLSSVEVWRNYLDSSTGTNLVWWNHKGNFNCYPGVDWSPSTIPLCSNVRQLACVYVLGQREGSVQFTPANYVDGAYVKTNYAVNRVPDGVEINFMRGYYDRYEEIDSQLSRAIIAMAHNNLPQNYCSCDVQTLYYQNDTKPLEPPVRLKSGQSTWGLYEAEQILKEFDRDRNSFMGGLF